MLTKRKIPKNQKLRNAEYYGLTKTFDRLYKQSTEGRNFKNLMNLIQCEQNITLAYRNIKKNKGGKTPGVDGKNIVDIGKLPETELIKLVRRKMMNYRPKAVRRVEIPKDNGKSRPLGIPCIIDRIVQQCILQVLEPICEAKFHDRNNGFRPNRSTENAMAQCYKMIQGYDLHYAVDIDIKGFFDNVNHKKLRRQIWSMGIQDKQLLCIINEMLKAPIELPNGKQEYVTKGTPQGGILSPLLANIVLNEMDWWLASQWETLPTKTTYSRGSLKNRALKRSKLKELYIVRYADDFKIFCRNHESATKIFKATTKWLTERLHLEISVEKSKVVNLKKNHSEFLGFQMKAVCKRDKYVAECHMSNKAISNAKVKLKKQIVRMQRPKNRRIFIEDINKYNSMVWGIHNTTNMLRISAMTLG